MKKSDKAAQMCNQRGYQGGTVTFLIKNYYRK